MQLFLQPREIINRYLSSKTETVLETGGWEERKPFSKFYNSF